MAVQTYTAKQRFGMIANERTQVYFDLGQVPNNMERNVTRFAAALEVLALGNPTYQMMLLLCSFSSAIPTPIPGDLFNIINGLQLHAAITTPGDATVGGEGTGGSCFGGVDAGVLMPTTIDPLRYMLGIVGITNLNGMASSPNTGVTAALTMQFSDRSTI